MGDGMQPRLYVPREEYPFEPFAGLPHVMQPAGVPEQEQESDINLWPRQEPVNMPLHQEEPFNLFPRRDPFKAISTEAELPTGHYVSRNFFSKSHVGPDGKIVTQRYAYSGAGNSKEGIHEAKHLYTNSSSGFEKASHEQYLRGRGRMAVTEYGNGKEGSFSQLFHGMNETENEAFGQEFDTHAKYLPDRAKLNRDALDAPSNSFEGWSPALGYGNRHVVSMLGHGW